MKKTNKFVYWAPRILGIIFILFLMMFSLDIFEMNLSVWQTFIGLFMHNIPALFLLVVLIISWKYEIVGGIVFIFASLIYFLIMSGALIIAIPSFLIGILFLINWFKKRKKLKNKN
jgi:hypothetical protein